MPNDEINLIDYVKVILKRKKLIFLILILFLIGAFVFSITSPKIYKINSILELGQVEAPVQLIEKINSGVYNGKYQVRIIATNPPKTQLITMKIESAVPQEAKTVLAEINNRILEDHQKQTASQKESIKKNIKNTENKISLRAEDVKNAQKSIGFVQDNISKTRNKIAINQDDIQRVYNKISSKEKEKEALQDKVSALQEQLIYQQDPGTQFALFNAKEELEDKNQEIENLYLQINFLQRAIEDNNIQINSLESAIENHNLQIASLRSEKEDLLLQIELLNKELINFKDTKIVKQPTISKAPIRPRPMLNMIIAGVLGLFIGVFLAFAREWWQGANLSAA